MSHTSSTTNELVSQVKQGDRRFIAWLAFGFVLFVLQAGAVGTFVAGMLSDLLAAVPFGGPAADLFKGAQEFSRSLPTLLSRDVIPNAGHWNGEEWVGTFLGLSPALSWAIRVALVYLYSFTWVAWAIVGYWYYRNDIRVADWTPRDDVVERFRSHTWGLFGATVVFMFVVMAIFAPTLGPTTVDQNLRDTYSYEIDYWDEESQSVESAVVGQANRNSQSTGEDNRVMPMTYDSYDRFHPFGTLPDGADLFTFIVVGSRLSLIIGCLSVGLSASIAVSLALIAAYYKGRVDLSTVLLSDSVMAMPQLLLIIMLSTVLSDTWIQDVYSGGFILILFFAFTGWAYMWRSIRGPALQVSERMWIDAAKSFGQKPRIIMRRHMLPYVTGYILIYGSMTLGGVIIGIAGLSFLGLGVAPPTPEWGRAVKLGQDYVNTGSWHISLIPGVLVTLVVIGFNALGDGIRDAIDPQSDTAGGGAAGRGGGA
jgi:peptide/nickel transport system permease protein